MQCPRDILVKQIYRYLKGMLNLGLQFVKPPLTTLHGYCHTKWAGSWDDRRSITSFVNIYE